MNLSACKFLSMTSELSSFLLSSGWKFSVFQRIHFNVKRQHSSKNSIFPKWFIHACVILLYLKAFLHEHSKSAVHWLTLPCGKDSLLFFPSRLYGPQFGIYLTFSSRFESSLLWLLGSWIFLFNRVFTSRNAYLESYCCWWITANPEVLGGCHLLQTIKTTA